MEKAQLSARESRILNIGLKTAEQHRRLTHLCALMWKPAVLSHSYFGKDIVPLDAVSLYVLRRQWFQRGDMVLRSTPLMRFALTITPQNEVRLRRLSASELAIMPRNSDRRSFFAEHHPSLTDCVIQMADQLQQAHSTNTGRLSLPSMPSVYFTFRAGEMPAFAESPWLKRDAMHVANSDQHLSQLRLSFEVPRRAYPDWKIFSSVVGEERAQEFLHAVWMISPMTLENGHIGMPQEYFIGREDVKPVACVVDMAAHLGCDVPNPFPEVLRELNMWTGSTRVENRKEYEEKFLATVEPAAMRKAIAKAMDKLGPAAEGVTSEDWEKAMVEIYHPLRLPRLGRIDVVDIGYPSLETMTITERGNTYDLFSSYSGRDEFMPAPPNAWQHKSHPVHQKQPGKQHVNFSKPTEVPAAEPVSS